MLLTLDEVYKSYGANTVISGATAKIEDSARIGLVGVNGAGKSTLLSLITGEQQPDAGRVAVSNNIAIGYLKQNSGLASGGSIESEMLSAFKSLNGIEAEMRVLERQIANLPDHENSPEYPLLASRYGSLQARFEQREGYNINVRVSTVLNGMGFGGVARDTLVDTLSGGEKTRLAICKLLLEDPELLILDEPTNHLDFKTLTWLEDYLQASKAALLVVSHDRYFLDKLCTSIWDLERRALTVYNGGYSHYVLQKEERLVRQQKEYDIQQEEIAKLKDFVARNLTRASTTARAQSKRRTLEKMELVEKPKPPPPRAKIRFEYRQEPVKDVLHAENLQLAVGAGENQKTLFADLNFDLLRGEKIAMIGANGVGKSSLMKALLGLLPKTSGHIEWGKNTEVSYFEQEDFALNSGETALNELWNRFPREYEHRIRTVLGNVGLTGENVNKLCSELSGGERAKLKFAILVLHCGNVLFMDEPTNHLDLSAKEALDTALRAYTGTLLVISHDRYLLNKFPDKIAEMGPGGITLYRGNYDSYLAQKALDANKKPQETAQKEPERPPEKSNEYFRSKKQRSEEAAHKRRVDGLEAKIAELETEIFRLENELASDGVASDYIRVKDTCDRLEQKQAELDACLTEWTALNE